MSTDILIRPYNDATDKKEVLRLAEKTFLKFFLIPIPDHVTEEYSDIPHNFTQMFVMTHEDNIIGTCGITCNPQGYPGEYFLSRFYIDEAFQNQGIGSRVLEYVIDWIKAQGAKIITLL